MSWECKKCGAISEDSFYVCQECGTHISGETYRGNALNVALIKTEIFHLFRISGRWGHFFGSFTGVLAARSTGCSHWSISSLVSPWPF